MNTLQNPVFRGAIYSSSWKNDWNKFLLFKWTFKPSGPSGCCLSQFSQHDASCSISTSLDVLVFHQIVTTGTPLDIQVVRGTVKVDLFMLAHIMVTLSTAWDESTESRVQCNVKLLGQLPLLRLRFTFPQHIFN